MGHKGRFRAFWTIWLAAPLFEDLRDHFFSAPVGIILVEDGPVAPPTVRDKIHKRFFGLRGIVGLLGVLC